MTAVDVVLVVAAVVAAVAAVAVWPLGRAMVRSRRWERGHRR